MNTTKPGQRSAYWDNLKGLLMLLVVFAHVIYQLQLSSPHIDRTVDYIYIFHMPAFVFISGYFGKSEKSHSLESIVKLIFLYFIFNSIVGFIYGFESLLVPMYSFWYLLALIVWRLTAHHIAKFKEINLILFAVALFAGFYPSIDNTFSAARIIGFYPYYMLGYQLSTQKSEELINKKYSKRAPLGLLLFALTSGAAVAARIFFEYKDGDLQMASYAGPKDAFGRIVLYIIAFSAIYALRCLAPNRKLPLLTMFGRNSLWIFILHRPVTLLLSDRIGKLSVPVIMLIAAGAAVVICLIFGNDFVCKYLNMFLAAGANIFTGKGKKTRFDLSKLAALCVALGFVASVVVNYYQKYIFNEDEEQEIASEQQSTDVLYPTMTDDKQKEFDSAFRITFAGDLILLEDQVKRAYNGKDYDFTDVFEYAKPYISSADLAIGVFEGPMAGAEAGYSTGNFDDNKELYLNFPDSFAQAVKDSGFDLVTTANNHLLDKGEKGAMRTLDVLDKIGLDHTGSYRSAKDKQENRIKIIEKDGLKLAVLSYTYGSNYVDNKKLIEGEYSYITSVASGMSGNTFEKLKAQVEEDFKQAKALSPDLIVVLPHIGTQFDNDPQEEQLVWFNIFKDNGADIILGDHPHVVEPALLESKDDRTVFTAYCPGNFANVYRDNQGDTSMLTDVYIDRTTKKVIGGSVVPLYTHAMAQGNFRAVPVYEIMNNAELRKQLTTDDIRRADVANDTVTKVVFGNAINASSAQKRYYFDENGFIRTKTAPVQIDSDMKNGLLYTKLKKADSVCFIGDSVTEGTKNGGCPWYEPIAENFKDKKIQNYSKGSCTTSYMVQRTDEIPKADLYVIAVGTNDVRYRDESMCAMTAEDYTKSIEKLRSKLAEKSPTAEFIFIAPWYSTDGDPYAKLDFSEKTEMNEQYSDALEKYCKEKSLGFINANGYIKEKLTYYPDRTFLLDHIHPNASKGVEMYSQAVLSAK